MSDIRRTWRWQRIRKSMIAAALLSPDPYLCWRCEMAITAAELPHADLGHVVDIGYETPGMRPRLRLEHPSCNRAAGMAAQHERTKIARHTVSKAWESAEL